MGPFRTPSEAIGFFLFLPLLFLFTLVVFTIPAKLFGNYYTGYLAIGFALPFFFRNFQRRNLWQGDPVRALIFALVWPMGLLYFALLSFEKSPLSSAE